MNTRQSRLAVLERTSRVWDGRAHPDDAASDTTAGLIQLCRDWIRPTYIMVEVGCFRGVSTSVFAEFARLVYAVDPWTMLAGTGYREVPLAMLVQAEGQFASVAGHYRNIYPLRAFSADAAALFQDESLDAVYIDGDHSRLLDDFAAWEPKVKRGGIVSGHDYHNGLHAHWDHGMLPKPDALYPDTSWVVVKRWAGSCKAPPGIA